MIVFIFFLIISNVHEESVKSVLQQIMCTTKNFEQKTYVHIKKTACNGIRNFKML